MNTFITQFNSLFSKKHLKPLKGLIPIVIFSVLTLMIQSWTTIDELAEVEIAANFENPAMVLTPVGAWDQLTAAQRQTLQNGGTVQNFNLGICDLGGQGITADIVSSAAADAPDASSINAREPRRWGNSSFYLARQNMGGAGVEYCFEFSTPVSFGMDSREHAYFANFENITVSASNGGVPINLTGSYPIAGDPAPATINGNGSPSINFDAAGWPGGGLWWEVSSNGQSVTEVCIQYFTLNPGELPTVEPFRLLVDGTKCIADSPIVCDESAFISRWNKLNNSDRINLNNGVPVHQFNTGFCDESGNPINFIEINAAPAQNSFGSGLNNKEPRPYGEYSLDNGREDLGMGGNTYCFTLDEARPFRVNSLEHSFFAANEHIIVSAFLGADPVILSGFLAGTGAVGGTPTGISFEGTGYGNGYLWEASSLDQPVSQICVEYFNFNGAALGREPFALELCADRCIYDDRYACSQNPGGAPGCFGLPNLQITKNIYSINDYGLDACNSASGDVENAQFEIEIKIENFGGTVKQLWLEEDLLSYFGAAYIDTVTAPTISVSSASGPPQIDPFFDGRNYTDIFIPGSGFLQNGQFIIINFIIELDANAPGAYTDLINTAYGGGIGNGGFGANDLSGGLWAGDGVPTSIGSIPTNYTTVLAEDLTLEATLPNYMNGIFPWLADNGGAEFSVPNCSPVTWTSDYNYSLDLNDQPGWVDGCGQITGSIEVTFFGTDACGHTFTTCATFTLEDTQGPSCTKPSDLVLNCGDPDALNILQNWLDYVNGNWTDLSQPVVFTNDFMGLTPGSCDGDPVLVTWTATDACGNESYFDATLTVIDNTAPIIIGVPPSTTVQICDDLPDPANVTATDGCDLDVEITFNEMTTGSGCNQTIIREWTATDDCGNSVSGSQTITVTDDINPILVGVPSDMTMQCTGNVPSAPNVTATDNCDDDVDVTFDEVQDGSGCNLTITRTWTATDDCGNSVSASQTISIGDTEAPVLFNIPGNANVECNANIPAVPGNVTATDNCDDDVEITFDEIETGVDCNLTVTRTWTATDDCGNSTSASYFIIVADEESPVFSDVPGDITVTCPDIPAVENPTVSDNCDLDVTVAFEEVVIGGPCPAPLQIIRTWTATDDCNNTSSIQQVINVEEMASMITFTYVPPDVTATCDENPMFGEPEVETTCSLGGLTLSFENEVISSGDCSQPFTVIRTWTAHDDCGNLEEVSQTLNIGPDTEAPIFASSNPTSIMVDCGADLILPIAFDNCGATSLDYIDTNVTGDCATGFNFTRTWTATDLCGNSSTFSQEVTTNPDMTPPVFTSIPFNQYFDCDEDIVFPEPIAVDNCTNVTITFQDSIIGTGDCNEVDGVIYGYDIIRTWTATDECGNSASVITEAWVIPGYGMGNLIGFSYMPENQTVNCGEPMPFGEPVSHSACSDVTLTYVDDYIIDCDNGHAIVRTWTSVDDCGNEISASQTISFGMDTQGPVFTSIPADGTFSCTGGATPIFGTPIAEDNCVMGLAIQVAYTDVWQSLGGCDGEIVTRTWTATDACGNQSTASQTLTMIDEQAPVFTIIPADFTINCGEPMAFGSVAASDNCSAVNVTFNDETVTTCEGNYAVTRTWTASDNCGNQNFASQTITVEDTEAPVFLTSVTDQTIQCGQPVVFTEVEAIDGCSMVTITFEDEETPGCESYFTRTWTASDACGNSTQLSQTIQVLDTEAPVFDAMPVQLSMSQADFATWQMPAGTASDCGAVNVEVNTTSQASCEAILYSYFYTATDDCGNEAEHLLTVSVFDAVFAAEMEMPTAFECGNTHDMTANVANGTAPYDYTWTLLSGNGWELASGSNEATATIQAGEGTANISLQVTDANGCIFAEQELVQCSLVSAVSSANVEAFTLLPNPATDFVTAKFTSRISGGGELLVLNPLGEVVTYSKLNVRNGINEEIIDISSFAAGTYILQLKLRDETISERFLKLW